jgi:hypothetical protein
MTTTDIVASIDGRLTDAKAEIVQLQSAREALINGVAAAATPKPRRAPRKPTPPKAAPPKAVRAKRVAVPADELTALLGGSSGVSTSELAEATNGTPAQILALLRGLEAADQVRRTGQRRGTRWHLITDEDRIAARAAEIAAQSKRRRARRT